MCQNSSFEPSTVNIDSGVRPVGAALSYSSPGLGLESDSRPVFWDLDLRPMDLDLDLDLDLTHQDCSLGVLNENTLIFKVFF